MMIRKLNNPSRRAGAMDAVRAEQAVADGAVLLDVREPKEWRAGHAPAARHLVLSQLEDHLAELPVDQVIVAVCRSGRRSAMAVNLLARHGYTAINLTGGMQSWAAAGLPVVTNGNKTGLII